ncbi:MAG TPA: type VI secretion system ImpA family N-terminal domain-containing protein, partial [Steroidobacteraceae bacterium]
MTHELEALTAPLSAAAPCGSDLEYTPLLATFDAYRLFGSDYPPAADTDWRAIRDNSLLGLAQSRDLRLLAHLAAALIRIEGLTTFSNLITVAERWLTEYWDQVFPRIDED